MTGVLSWLDLPNSILRPRDHNYRNEPYGVCLFSKPLASFMSPARNHLHQDDERTQVIIELCRKLSNALPT